jgi:hemerythrin superfamily protein
MTATVGDLIRADHREFERLFAELKDPMKRPLNAPVLVALLAAHARAEESEVYPALRQEGGAQSEVAHSQEEHAEADELAAKLVTKEIGDSAFDDVLAQLVKSVSHHLEEEEETVLPALDRLPTDTQESLAKGFIEVRAKHLVAGATDLSRVELETQARNEGIENVRSLSKSELAEEVRD